MPPDTPLHFRQPGPAASAGPVLVTPARPEDLPRILEIQKASFLPEAEAVRDLNAPPMVETLEGVQEDIRNCVILKAVGRDGIILGSVRGRRKEGVYVSKLSVDVPAQGRGVAKALMLALERFLPSGRYWLFTRAGNPVSTGLYRKLGYAVFREEDVSPWMRQAFFEKITREGSGGDT
jgi:ribosomal protein S18 acetylase RimI-like enzyme